jgi:hypothetical protein
LGRKWFQCQDRKRDAAAALNDLKIPESALREQWNQQVQAQTKPAPRASIYSPRVDVVEHAISGRSNKSGKQEVEAILILEDSLKGQQKHVRQLEEQLGKDSGDVVEIGMQLRSAQANCARLADLIRRKRASLGVGQRTVLKKMKESVFLQVRMNARALKIRIRDRLRHRKFELERLEHSYRHVVNGGPEPAPLDSVDAHLEHKLTHHTATSVKRREPGISKLAKTYNNYCKEMRTLVSQCQAPRKAFVPQPIDPQKLFALDVDDDIWQDAEFDDEEGVGVPLWLGSDDVRKGIKHLLTLDRCFEEESRLKQERAAMQLWMHEEWEILQGAIATHGVYIGKDARFF